MKKIFLIIIILTSIIVAFMILFILYNNTNFKNSNLTENNVTISNNINESKEEYMDLIYIKVNNQVLNVELVNNSATQELKEK